MEVCLKLFGQSLIEAIKCYIHYVLCEDVLFNPNADGKLRAPASYLIYTRFTSSLTIHRIGGNKSSQVRLMTRPCTPYLMPSGKTLRSPRSVCSLYFGSINVRLLSNKSPKKSQLSSDCLLV